MKKYLYCFRCCGIPDGVLMTAKPRCGDCRRRDGYLSELKEVSCLVCLDQHEVSALGEERDCPRGCKPKLNFYQTMQWGDAEAARLGAEQALATNLVIYRPSTIPLDTEATDGYTLEDSKGDE